MMTPDQAILVILSAALLSGVVAYFVSWVVVHDAIDNERKIQARKQERKAISDWEKTHIPDEPDVLYRRRR